MRNFRKRTIVIGSLKNEGYEVAIKALFEAARERNADIMVTLDSDGPHDPEQIPEIIKPLTSEGVNLVIGSRFLNSQDKEKVLRYRGFGIRTITRLTQVVYYHNISWRASNQECLPI